MAEAPAKHGWIQLAEQIRAELKETPWGGKAKVFERYAKKTRFHPASLKREVMALEAILRFDQSDPAFAGNLRQLGSTSVLELVRMYKSKPKEAKAAAREAAAGGLTVRQLKARRTKRDEPERRTLLRQETVEFARALRRRYGLELQLEGAEEFERDGAFALRLKDGSDTCIGYRQIGPFSNNEKYLMDFLALAYVHDRVFVGIDQAQLPASWETLLAKASQRGARLSVFGRDLYQIVPLFVVGLP